MHYSDATKTREGWVHSLLEEYRSNMEMLKNVISGQSQCSPQHGEISCLSDWLLILKTAFEVAAKLNSCHPFSPVGSSLRPWISFIKVCSEQATIVQKEIGIHHTCVQTALWNVDQVQTL